jgi:extradiol dioxygenase family protein
VCHWVGNDYKAPEYYNPVGGDDVPVPHFGIVLDKAQFHELAQRIQAAGVKFVIPVSMHERADVVGSSGL